jgi:hypothetical protein
MIIGCLDLYIALVFFLLKTGRWIMSELLIFIFAVMVYFTEAMADCLSLCC